MAHVPPRSEAAPAAVAVVGSANLDIVVPVPHHPAPGETVLGGDHFRNPGGKGANQAVAAARLGQSVALVGRVGADDAGRALLDALRGDGVDVAHVTVGDAPTGLALIGVDPDGENAIMVSPGANARVGAADVAAAVGVVRSAAVTLLQLEVSVAAALAAATAAGGTVVLNPAPARRLPPELLARVDVLVPNRAELGVLADAPPPRDLHGVAALASRLAGPSAVVVTLGGDGALLVAGDEVEHVPALPVPVVDTTAAGDAFCGALADAFVRGAALRDAVAWAARVAAVTVTRAGAQPSLPGRADVDRLTVDRG